MRSKLIRRIDDFLSCRLAEEHPQGRLHQFVERPAVTLSRQAGTRGLEIGAKLMDYLGQFDETAEHGWALFDQSLLAKVIEDRRLPDVVVESPMGKSRQEPPIEVVETLHATPPAQWTLFQHSVNAIRRLCRLGNVIIIGRGANFVTRDLPNAFHVRLIGPADYRTEEVMHSLGLAENEATSWINSTDQGRAAYVERHFGEELDDPTAYHLTINTGRIDEDKAARLIGDALLEWTCSRCLTTGG